MDFYRNWTEYKKGFGNSNGEYWLGNDFIHQLTSLASYTLKIILTDWKNNVSYAEYTTFYVTNEIFKYTLIIGGYSGDAGDWLAFHNGEQFSTWDRDNDKNINQTCFLNCGKGAWWYGNCCHSNLNAVYSNSTLLYKSGMAWPLHTTMKTSEMMIKRK